MEYNRRKWTTSQTKNPLKAYFSRGLWISMDSYMVPVVGLEPTRF